MSAPDLTSDLTSVFRAEHGRVVGSARTESRHSQQVLAGIGFTTEHELHEQIRRVVLLDQLFGGAVNLTRALGDEILATSTLPDLLPL